MPFPVTQTMAESAEGRMSNKRQIKHLKSVRNTELQMP